ncbi:hypothetical protein [Paenibacillus sp.]|nr:hypothetical protein [Paenibacillus sp.]HZG84068.1 hypothetical protein [Paenibacillus sp.]
MPKNIIGSVEELRNKLLTIIEQWLIQEEERLKQQSNMSEGTNVTGGIE